MFSELVVVFDVQSKKLNAIAQKLQTKGKRLFGLCVEAQKHRDIARASMYANEIAELRQFYRIVQRSQCGLEQAKEGLRIAGESRHPISGLGQVVEVLRQIENELGKIIPEIANHLAEIVERLEILLVEVKRIESSTPEEPSLWQVLESQQDMHEAAA